MAIPHTRDPSRFNDSDYGEFCVVLEYFLSSSSSLPHRPEHLVAQQQTLGQAYQNKLDEYRLAREDSGTATSAMDKATDALSDKMRWLKFALPGLTPGDDSILEPFGLDKDIPTAQAELKDYADVVWGHWQEVSNEPLFAPLKADINTVGDAITAFQAALDAQIAAQDEMYHLQNEKDEARNAHNALERDIFKWYRIYYKDPKDDYWTDTPWGKADGPKIPAPKNFAYDKIAEKFSWDKVENADEYEVQYSEHGESEDWTTLYKGADNETTNKPSEPDVYDFRVRAIMGDKDGKWSKVLVVNFPNGGVLPAPNGFKFEDSKQLFSWDFLELALVYQLEISRDGGQTWVQKYQDVDTYFDARALDAGEALARVRALDGYQEPGEWTEPIAVIFKILPPAWVAYSQYKNEFTWDWVVNAESYELELDDGSGSGFIQIYKGLDNHVVHDLAKGTYKFRVRACRGVLFSDWSPEFESVIQFSAPAGLLYDDSAHKIKWDKVTDAAQYHLVNETGTVSYIGADNHLDIELQAAENFRVRAGGAGMDVWGEWSAWTSLG